MDAMGIPILDCEETPSENPSCLKIIEDNYTINTLVFTINFRNLIHGNKTAAAAGTRMMTADPRLNHVAASAMNGVRQRLQSISMMQQYYAMPVDLIN